MSMATCFSQRGERVFLKVPRHSQSLKTGKVAKLSPRYCGAFTILKRIGQVAYKLALPEHSRIHRVFHVSPLRKQLGYNDNIVDTRVLVDKIEPPSVPHEPECILDRHEKRTRHYARQQMLVKWKNRPDEGSTWENVSVLKKCFPSFVFEGENNFSRGG